MKCSNSALSAVFLLLLCSPAVSEELRIEWGIERPAFYTEREATARQNAAVNSPRQPNERQYRYFTIADNGYEHLTATERVAKRHWGLWSLYKKTTQSPSPEGYAAFSNKRDPYFAGSVRELAPVLFFDFIGAATREYVLERIEVQTIEFEEYRGGGFTDKEAGYDVVLSHKPGTKTHPVERKLRFSGSGRAELRLWSDNFYKNVGLTPMGCYMINITFHFLSDGKPTKVSTGPFKIDV